MKEQYKRLLNMSAGIVLLVIETALFSAIWYAFYNTMVSDNFTGFRGKGNIAIIGIYALLICLFTKALGGYKVGYLKITEVCMSQVIAIVCTNVVEYAELCIVLYNWISPAKMIILTVIEIMIAFVWAYIFRRLYISMYPPHNMIFVCGETRVQRELVEKINSRGDKYDIRESISISEGIDKIYEAIKGYESVIIGDIPAQIVRRRIVGGVNSTLV